MTAAEKEEVIEKAEQQIKKILVSLENKVGEIERVTVDVNEFMEVSVYLA